MRNNSYVLSSNLHSVICFYLIVYTPKGACAIMSVHKKQSSTESKKSYQRHGERLSFLLGAAAYVSDAALRELQPPLPHHALVGTRPLLENAQVFMAVDEVDRLVPADPRKGRGFLPRVSALVSRRYGRFFRRAVPPTRRSFRDIFPAFSCVLPLDKATRLCYNESVHTTDGSGIDHREYGGIQSPTVWAKSSG